MSYDGIGRLIGKNIGGIVVNNTLTFAENLTMSYNPRNWLTSINGKSAKNDAFNYSLQYTEAGQFNGNIGKMILNDKVTSYTYDGINRLRLADGLDVAGKQMKEQISYDLNGNILSLNRTMGGLEIDNLAYGYKPNSNQLQAVTDNVSAHNGLGYYDGNKTATNFTYDNNGSMTSDLDKSLTLTYNRLNLVQIAQINTSKQVYLYNTQGDKMAQKIDGQTKAYVFGSEYINGELARMQTAEGFVSKNLNWKVGSTEKKYPYSFTVSDHLGNIRVVVNEQGQVQQKNEYTAFGVVQSTDPSKNNYLFNNKELQTGTNYLDYGARMYQPELGRWNAVDPLGEKSRRWSPYNFSFNNPLRFVDPDGMKPTPAEAARMAAHVYGGYSNSTLIGGWGVSNRDFGLSKSALNNAATGLKSQVYERTVGGNKEYSYATAGTEASWKDVGADVKQPLGLSEQYSNSVDNAVAISKEIGKAELTFVGHSLGGGEAALNAKITDRSAITFNAAGVSPITQIKEGGLSTPFKSESKIQAIIMRTDPLNLTQNNGILPNVNGVRSYVTPTTTSSVINGHSIDNMVKELDKKR